MPWCLRQFPVAAVVLASYSAVRPVGVPALSGKGKQTDTCTNFECQCRDNCLGEFHSSSTASPLQCASLFQGSYSRQRVSNPTVIPKEDFEDSAPRDHFSSAQAGPGLREQRKGPKATFYRQKIRSSNRSSVVESAPQARPSDSSTPEPLAQAQVLASEDTQGKVHSHHTGATYSKHKAQQHQLQALSSYLTAYGNMLFFRSRERANAILYRSKSMTFVTVGVIALVALLFCVAVLGHSFVRAPTKELKPMRADTKAVSSQPMLREISSPIPREITAPSPRTASAASIRADYRKPQPADVPGRFLSRDAVPPPSAPVPHEPVRFVPSEQTPRTSSEEVSASPVDVDGSHLCPELVVPSGSECTLVIPRVGPTSSGLSPLSICDARGVPVFKASFSSSGDAGARRLALSSATGDAVFSFCRDLPYDPATGQRGFAIFHYSERRFGELRADGPRPANGYSITSRKGWRVRFRGDPEGRNLNATDDHGRLLAITEGVGTGTRSVRIGPVVDAGLIAMAVLGIDLLGQEPLNI